MIGFIIDCVLCIVAITYIVKYYKFKKSAELEFIDYERRLKDSEFKVKESEYMYESGVKLYQSEHGGLDPDEENKKIQEKQQTQKILQDSLNSDSIDLAPIINRIEEIYKQKEEEIKRRMDAEKRVEIALQRVEEVEAKIEDFRIIQNLNLGNIKKIASNLYKKIKVDINNINQNR